MTAMAGWALGVRRGATVAGLLVLAACAAQPPDGVGAHSAPQALPAAPGDNPVDSTVAIGSLLYSSSGEVRARFGDPHAQRRDGGAIVWNYEAEGVCRLNLVLQGVRGAATVVVHTQARMAEGATEAGCFDRLRQVARASPVPVLETVAAPAAPAVAPRRAAPPRPPPRRGR